MTLDTSNWLALGGITAIVAAGWRYVKMVWDFLSSFVVGHLKFNDADVEMIFFNHLWRNYKRVCLTSGRAVTTCNEPIKATGRSEMIACESQITMRWLFWIKGRPLFWNKDIRKSDGGILAGGVGWIRGTMDIEKMIEASMREYKARFNIQGRRNGAERFHVHLVHGTSGGGVSGMMANFMRERGGQGDGVTASSGPGAPAPPSAAKEVHTTQSGMVHQLWLETAKFFNHTIADFGRASVIRALDLMALDPEAKALVEELERWLQSEDWFRKRGVPWRRGVLLYGPPGTGKTSILRAIAEYLDIPIFVLDLGSMNNLELMKHWGNAVVNAPCMIVVEDIDGVFDGRENVLGEKGGGLSFDAFLNTIDGMERANGVIFAVTTNRIDKVDPALGKPVKGHEEISTRPGRIDRVIYLKNPDEEGRRKIAGRILCDWPERIEALVEEGTQDTGAQFQDRCVRLAQRLFWEEKARRA